MEKYIKYARVYPSIIAMILPAILSSLYLEGVLSTYMTTFTHSLRLLVLFVPVAVVYAAIGYFFRELFRETSKQLFQFPLFREDETKMPTTKLLLWKDKTLDDKTKKRIREKLKEKHGVALYGQKDELQKPEVAAKAIVSAVSLMRQDTRQDPILLQYNYEFGFARNYLGASVWSLLVILAITITNHFVCRISVPLTWSFFCIQILLSAIFFLSLKHRGLAYARQLFASFETLD